MEAAAVPLLKEPMNTGRKIGFTRWRSVAAELNRVNLIALPMTVVTISQYLLRTSPMFMLGHLDELSLSSASIATSLSNVTGFSFLFGVASALETLCGQAYGAEQYQRIGTFTYGAILCLFIVCIPISILWMYTEKLLIFVGQDPVISAEAGKFMIWLIPTLFPYAILQSVVRFLQAQSLTIPMLWTALASLCLQLSLCWAFIFKLNLGNAGAAVSIGISYWFNVILLVLYVKFSPTCKKTRASFSRDVFLTMREFFQFAVPSAGMVCLEWWSYELVILLSGLLPNPLLETSVLSICMTITLIHYNIPYSFGAAASTLVSNELGAGKPEAARVAVVAVLVLSIAEVLIACSCIYGFHHILGYAFSHEKEVVNYVKEMAPLLCLSIIMDCFQCVLSGVARGSGWQHIGAYVNLGAYYLVGLPVSLLLGFVLQLEGKGLLGGLIVGTAVQSLLFFIVTGLTNWEKQAREARLRILSGKFPADQNPSILKNEELGDRCMREFAHAPFAPDILPSMREFFRFAVSSAVMVCLEWWSCEILVLLSGLLPNPQLETSVLSLCLVVASLHYFIPYSVGAPASTRVSNELGAGFPDRARVSVFAASFLSIAEAVVACTFLLCCRNFLGYAFSNEKEVVDYLRDISPFVCLLLAMDCIQTVLSGVARGSGRQHLGAYVNLGAYYLVGLPIAVVLGFVLHLRGKDLWLGLNMGSIVQSTLLFVVTCSTNWRKQASMARQRIFEGTWPQIMKKFRH